MRPLQTISLSLLALAAAPVLCSPLPLPLDAPEQPPPMPPGVIRRRDSDHPPSRIYARSLGHDSLNLHSVGGRDLLDLKVNTGPLAHHPGHEAHDGHEHRESLLSSQAALFRSKSFHHEPRRDPLSDPLSVPKDPLPASVSLSKSRRGQSAADALIFNLDPRPLIHLRSEERSLEARSPDSNLLENLSSSNAYSGAAGNAAGGSVSSLPLPDGSKPGGLLGSLNPGGGSLLSLFSGNAGNGGQASSGTAGGPGRGRFPGSKFVTKKGKNGIPTLVPVDNLGSGNSAATISDSIGNAFSGAAGNAAGGSVTGPASLIDLFSHNAGNAGEADSGLSRALKRSVGRIEKRFKDIALRDGHEGIQNPDLYPRIPNAQTAPKMPINPYPMSSPPSTNLAKRGSSRKIPSRFTARQSPKIGLRDNSWTARPLPDLNKFRMGQGGPRRIRNGAPIAARPRSKYALRRFARRGLAGTPVDEGSRWPILSPWPLDRDLEHNAGNPQTLPHPALGNPTARFGDKIEEGWMEWLQRVEIRLGWISAMMKAGNWVPHNALPSVKLGTWPSLPSLTSLLALPSSRPVTPQAPLALVSDSVLTKSVVQTGGDSPSVPTPGLAEKSQGHEECGDVEATPPGPLLSSASTSPHQSSDGRDQGMWSCLCQWIRKRIGGGGGGSRSRTANITTLKVDTSISVGRGPLERWLDAVAWMQGRRA